MSPTPVIHTITHPGPLGNMTLAATEHGLCGLYFEQHKYFLGTAGWLPGGSTQHHLQAAADQLDAYFSGTLARFDLALDLTGTPFQREIWQALGEIGYGTTTSYGKLAERIGRPTAMRAAGTAIGHNPVSIVVPCHRVLGADGTLAGYAGGLERKRFLLALESRDKKR